ncbi:hypothetical protein CFP56_010898, partial [Quercus suber]
MSSVAPPTSVSDYNGYKDPRDKNMDAFSRGKTVDESLYAIRDRKVNITPDASLYALCQSWLRNGISEEFQGDESVEDLSPKDLLKRHVKHAKKIKGRAVTTNVEKIKINILEHGCKLQLHALTNK